MTLKDLTRAKKIIKSTQEEIDFWKARSLSPTSSRTDTNYNPNKNIESMQNLCAEKVMELEQRLVKEKADYERLYDIALRTIMKLDKMEYKKLLVCKYIDDMPWEEIVKMMGYSERHIYKIQKKAETAFDSIIN